MDVQSPPKRVTRARAAAATGGSSSAPKSTTTKAAAASKATASKAAAAVRTAPSTKRKTRADEENDEETHDTADELAPTSADTMNKPPRARGRPKKIVEPALQQQPDQPEQSNDSSSSTAPTRATRGRAKKTTTGPSKPEPVKATRTRTTRKVAQPEEDKADTPSEPPKKSARTRATAVTKKAPGTVCTSATTNPTPGLKSAVSRPTAKVVNVKKSVSFQEPEKENVVPAATTTATTSKAKEKKAETATGMRAKPVRKAAGTAARATRASTRTTTSDDDKKEKPAPLSPKKDTLNRSLSRDSDSDDELATYEKTPLKPMMKSPVKPPSAFKMIDHGFPTAEKEDETEEAAEHQPEDAPGATVLTSPARRPASSPFKDAMKSPAKRVEGVPALLFPSKDASDLTQSPTKASLLQSPAKRPQVPIARFQPPTDGESDRTKSPLKMSLMGSPAKRPASPLKLLGSPIRSAVTKTEDSAPSAEGASGAEDNVADEAHEVSGISEVSEAQSEIHVADNDIVDSAVVETEAAVEQPEVAEVEQAEIRFDSPQQLEFPGRLSAVLPRYADPALQEKRSATADAAPEPEQTIAADEAELEAQPEPAPTAPEEAHQDEDSMDVDMSDAEEDRAHDISPESSPPRSAIKPSNPMFGLRQKDMVPYDSDESEDELASSGRKPQEEATLTLSAVPATPTPGATKTLRNGLPTSAIKAADRAIRSVSRGSKLGFTPLARQLNDWRAGSPLKLGSSQSSTPADDVGEEDLSLVEVNTPKSNRASPAKSSYFEDEMRVRAEMEADESEISFDADAEMLAALEADIGANYDDPVFDDIPVTEAKPRDRPGRGESTVSRDLQPVAVESPPLRRLCRPPRPPMASPDVLFNLRNLFYLGAYQAAINNSDVPGLDADAAAERDAIVFRSYVALGSYQLVISEIDSSAATSLQAVKLLALYLSGDKEGAISSLKEWLSDSAIGSNPVLRLIAGIVFMHEQDYNEALKHTHSGGTLDLHALNIQIFIKMHRSDYAEKQLKIMQQIDEDHTLTQLANAWLDIAVGGSKIREAYLIFQDFAEKYPMTGMVLNGKAVCCMHMGSFEEAETLLLEALNKDAKDPETLANLIVCNLHLGKPSSRFLSQLKLSHPDHVLVKRAVSAEDNFERALQAVA